MATFRGFGSVYDPTQAKMIADFNEAGEFTTNDPDTIARLTKMGYDNLTATTEAAPMAVEVEPVAPVVAEADPESDDVATGEEP